MDLIAFRDGQSDTLERESYLIRSWDPADADEHRNELRDGILLSRWFIITYQAAVIGVVLAFTLCRQYDRWRRYWWIAKRRRTPADERSNSGNGKSTPKNGIVSSSSSSASSSTHGGYTTPPAEAVKASNERTPLVDPESPIRSLARYHRPWRYIQAALLYQPPSLPILGRIMPPHETSLWILSLFGLNVFYLSYGISWNSSLSSVLADRSGLLFVANLPWLYLVAAKNQPLKLLTGDSYENLNLLHRRLGEWMCFLAALHLGGMLFAWYNLLRPLGFSLIRFITLGYVLWGCGAWVCYEVLYFLSLGSFREWWYEVFLGSHVVLQAAGLVTLFLHHYASRPYVGTALAIFVLDRVVWRLGIKTSKMRVDLKVFEDDDTVLVSADWPVLPRQGVEYFWRKFLGLDIKYGWNPSEHVFITVPGISTKHKLQFHPITIASAAPGPEQKHAWLNLIIRAKGGFSKDLLQYARNHRSADVRLDGPYGSLHALEMLQASDVAMIVAGGSGIAVAYPLIWSLLRGTTVVDNVRSSQELKQQVCLIWIVQDSSHLSWIGHERLKELKQLGLHILIPPPSKKQGRPDIKTLLFDKLDDLGMDQSKIGVVVSGPDGLNRSVQNSCADMVRKGWHVEVAVEKFGW